ncbi:IclR family transcriptional regulator [Rhodococcus opacus]|uniref:IclR family transcriptional regulator n=1 Tax=Rhodococcus opacus TaxID=37919 RepID=A0A076F0P2_RHOOP|nr:IclR family transcriptional regulator [Rhodococcus opacus]AII10997.1 hypothetical protein EP51_43650 [Rhodococcus opacus]
MVEVADERPAPPYPIESVDRTLTLIRMLAERREVKLSEVREQLGVGQSTAHRLLAMFVYRGFAVQDSATRAYRAGPALLTLRHDPEVRLDVARDIRPMLSWLARESGETAHFGVLDGTDVRYVDVVESNQVLRVTGRRAQTRPAHATSIGRAMLSAESDASVRARYRGGPSHADTHTDFDALLRELAQSRRRGYARNRGDVEPGVCSVGVAVVTRDGELLGGLSVAAPESRWSTPIERADVKLLLDVAAKLAASTE